MQLTPVEVPVAQLWAGRSGWNDMPVPRSWWTDPSSGSARNQWRGGAVIKLADAAAGPVPDPHEATIQYWMKQLSALGGSEPVSAIVAEYDEDDRGVPTWWVYDGFHRLVAAKRLGLASFYVRPPLPVDEAALGSVVRGARHRRLPADHPAKVAAMRRAMGGKLEHVYFASGSNHAGEIRGLAEIGHPFGIAVQEVNAQGMRELVRVAHEFPGALLFVDSGAFKEVRFNVPDKKTGVLPRPDLPLGPYDYEPIPPREWARRLGIYVELAKHWGPRMYAVAPDKVANQGVTLARLGRYRDIVRRLHRVHRANIIVPIHKGALSMVAFDRKIAHTLGFDDYIRGIAMAKDATKLPELEAFLRKAQPARIHLLGIGPTNDRAPAVREVVARALPRATGVFWDSVAITGLVGQERAGAQPLSRAQDAIREQLREHAWGTTPPTYMEGVQRLGPLDYTELIGLPSEWATPTALNKIAKTMFPPRSKIKAAFLADPDGFLQTAQDNGDPWYASPAMAQALDEAWAATHQSAMVAESKRQAFRHIFAYAPVWTWTKKAAAGAGAGTVDHVGKGVELQRVRGRSVWTIRRWGLVRKHGQGDVEWILVVAVEGPDGRIKKRRWSGTAAAVGTAKSLLQREDRHVGALGGK